MQPTTSWAEHARAMLCKEIRDQAIIGMMFEERDMLAQVCRDLSKQVATLMVQQWCRLSAETVVDAVRKRADEDGGLSMDALRETLVGLGCRP